MSLKSTAKNMYDGLGNSKAQRFRRLFLILVLVAGVLVYGFNKHAIQVRLGFGPNLEDVNP